MSYLKTKTTKKIILISLIIVFMWTSIEYGANNFTAYAPPIPDEFNIENNLATASINSLHNYTMTTGYTYNWIDVSGGTELFLADDGYAAIILPFDFPFYNQTFSTIYLCSNGYLSFTDTAPWQYSNYPFPSADPTHTYMIAPFWDDLQSYSGGGSGNIYVQSFGTYWVAEWLDIIAWQSGSLVGTFEVILHESGEIIFNYDYLSYTGGGYTCGLNLGADVQYYNSYQGLNDLTDDFSLKFTYETIPFFDDFESGLSKWQTYTNLWHLTNDSSSWPDSYHSPTHSMWFGNESTGNFDTGFSEMGDLISKPFSLPVYPEIILEFYHWREGELQPYDGSFVYISIDGNNWDLIYSDYGVISPWQKESINITQYAGNSSVQLKFVFDTIDSINNNYRGWLVDDIMITCDDLSVSLDTPVNPEIGNSYIINATVTNNGLNDEYDVDLLLYLDDVLVDSTTISSLPIGANETINYMWTPTEYKTYNFTAYAPPVPGETHIGDNIASELIYILDTKLFEGMYIDHIYTDPSYSVPSRFSYSYYSGSLFNETWDIMGNSFTWHVDYQTRLMSGGSNFGDGTHTPAWIFTNVSLGDEILIAADGEGDHLFNVSSELIYNLTSFGLIDVWVLEDLTLPGGVAWYEKSTGILLNGTFYYAGGLAWYTFDFVDTNVDFTYAVPPDDFILSSNAGTPDDDGNFDLTWASADGALTYSVYQYSSYITEINGSLTLLGAGITDLSLALSAYTNGIYYFIVVAHNNYGDTLSNCIEVVVGIPPGDFTLSSNAGTPDDNGAFDLSWTSAARALNYSVYEYSGYITEINGSLTLLIEGTTDLSLALSAYTNGIYYFIVVAHNNYGDTLSNCLVVVVLIPSVDGGIPGYNIYFIFAAIGIVSAIIIRKRRK